MKIAKRILLIALSVLMTLGSLSLGGCAAPSNRFYEGEALAYYNGLLAQGFPESYAEELTELHLLHPTWSFEPLLISSTNADFTWDYVIERETEDPSTNLIAPTKAYAAYRNANNSATYDSGYYQASVEAVKYFMDPRGFFNETDIFQFFDLSSVGGNTLQAVEAVVRGTFMEDVVLENGLTYAQNFVFIGEAVGIHPVYLAVKVYQEQGAKGGSPLVSGDCGDVLWHFYQNKIEKTSSGAEVILPESANREELLALNGYYNLMNVGAHGKGVFSIYQNAMVRAMRGSEEMSAAWGGSGAWDTVWKSIWGGALLLRHDYIERYQSTMYLQKFNVDGRSGRNFWGQYMQNVAGALSEARSLYQALADAGALDAPCSFLIPVYEDMPKRACPDPADGECAYLRSTDQKYSYSFSLRAPSAERVMGEPLYLRYEIKAGENFSLTGYAEHDYGIRRLEYSLDGGAWQSLDATGRFDLGISNALLGAGEHILTIRGVANYDGSNSARKSNCYFLCSVLYLSVG